MATTVRLPLAASAEQRQLSAANPAVRARLDAAAPSGRQDRWRLALLLVLAFSWRAAGWQRPLLGNFATKNVAYAMIARNWAAGRAEIWNPTVDCLVQGERGWHLTEWPAPVWAITQAWKLCGGSLDAWGRGASIAWSLLAVALAFWLARRWWGSSAAVCAGLIMACSPVSVIYGQSFMLEAPVATLTLAVVAALERWRTAERFSPRSGWSAVAASAWALLLLTKIYALVLIAPLIWLIWGRRRESCQGESSSAERLRGNDLLPARGARAAAVGVLLLATIPALWWYARAYRLAGDANTPVFYSIRSSVEVHRWPHPVLARPDFYRRVLDDLAGLTLTPLGLGLALLGLRRGGPLLPWLLAIGALLVALPLKFYEMNYYWLTVLSPLALLCGAGWQELQQTWRPARWQVGILVAVFLLFSLRHSVQPAFVTPAGDRSVPAAGLAVQAHLPRDAAIVTLHGSTIDLLYYADRPGWALDPRSAELPSHFEQAVQAGAQGIVFVGTSEERAAVTTLAEAHHARCVWTAADAAVWVLER